MSVTTQDAPSHRNLKNKLFVSTLGAILVVFLTCSALILLSNIWFLAQKAPDENITALGTPAVEASRSGWQIFKDELLDPQTHFAIKLSIATAAITAILSLIVGIPAAYVLSRYRLPGSRIIDTILDLPIVIPPPVMGLSLLIFFQTPLGTLTEETTGRWVFTQRGIILAQFFIACSFGIRAIKATFDTIGPRHEQVARTLGCTHAQAFFRVVLPMASTGIIAGAIMTWARAIAEFGPILFFCSALQWKTEVMPIAMFLNFSAGKIEESIALVLIMITISTVTLLTFKKLGGKGYLW